MVTKSYTVECMNALLWFAEREPVGWFDRTAPCHTMRSALERRGLIERIARKGLVGVVKFKLTDEGHQVLREAQR